MKEPAKSLISEIEFWSEMIELEKDRQKPEVIERMERARALAENRLFEYQTLDFSESRADEDEERSGLRSQENNLGQSRI